MWLNTYEFTLEVDHWFSRLVHNFNSFFFPQVECGSSRFPGGGIERTVIKRAHLLHFVRKTKGSAAQPGSNPAASRTVGSCPGTAGAPRKALGEHNCSQLAGVNRQVSPKIRLGVQSRAADVI